jgi:hypothetical protein
MSDEWEPAEEVLHAHSRLARGEGLPGDQEWLDETIPKLEAMILDPQCPEGYGRWVRACLNVIKLPPFEILCSECGRMKPNPAYADAVKQSAR